MQTKIIKIDDYRTSKIQSNYAELIFDLQDILFSEKVFTHNNRNTMQAEIKSVYESVVLPAVEEIAKIDELSDLEKETLLKLIRGNAI